MLVVDVRCNLLKNFLYKIRHSKKGINKRIDKKGNIVGKDFSWLLKETVLIYMNIRQKRKICILVR